MIHVQNAIRPYDSRHLFNSPARPTNLTVEFLWYDPMESAKFLQFDIQQMMTPTTKTNVRSFSLVERNLLVSDWLLLYRDAFRWNRVEFNKKLILILSVTMPKRWWTAYIHPQKNCKFHCHVIAIAINQTLKVFQQKCQHKKHNENE